MLKRYMPRSLFGRALIIIVAPLVLVQLVAGFIFYDRDWETVTRRLAAGLAGDVGTVAQFLAHYPDAELREWIELHLVDHDRLEHPFRARRHPRAYRARNRLRNPRAPAGQRAERARPAAVLPRRVDASARGDDRRAAPDGILHVRAQRERVFTSTVYVYIMWIVGSSLIFLAVASVFMRNQVRPIRRLAEAAEEFGKGRDVPDFRPAGAAEVRQAAAAFIVMRERIRRSSPNAPRCWPASATICARR